MDAPSTSDTTATTADRQIADSPTAEPQSDAVELDAPSNRKAPFPRGFLETISTGWAEHPAELPQPREQAAWAARRRARVSEAFPGRRVVVPAGGLKQRSNDTDYPFRAHSAFAHLTGWGRDAEPDAVLVFEPRDEGHEAVLYFRERADRTTAEFYSDATVGEFWIGPRPALDGVAADLDLATAHLSDFQPGDHDLTVDVDDEVTRFVSELRLIKDEYELAELALAVEVTGRGFDDIVAELPRSSSTRAGSAWSRACSTSARAPTATASATTPSPPRGRTPATCTGRATTAPVTPGDLILVDAGVEVDSLYTADITRTLPVSGTFTDIQRRIYETVREAADASFAAAKVGVPFRRLHEAAMEVIAARVAEWGLLPVTAEEALDADKGGQHRRYMVHGTSHHTSASTSTTALRPAATCTNDGCSSRAWCSRSSRVCTSRSTTSPFPRSTAVSARASRTTSS